eukprot:scaffold248408_cov103-Cyclotella_meneghiniana.AAC.5
MVNGPKAIGIKPLLLSSIWPMAVSPVMDLPVRSQSGVIVEEEDSECISVTSKPYRMWSVQPGRLGRRDVV